MSRLFAILLAAARATAFVETWRAYDQPQYAFTWQFPLLKNDTAGLGAGLTYAIHPTFCDRIIKSFSERSDIFYAFEFVSCRLLRGAIARAFASWAGNHPHITFIDRSATCDALGLEPSSAPRRQPSRRRCSRCDARVPNLNVYSKLDTPTCPLPRLHGHA